MEIFRHLVIYILPLILLFAGGSGVCRETINTAIALDYYWQYEDCGMSKNNFGANLFNNGALEKPGDIHEASCLKCHISHCFIKWGERFVPPKDELQFEPIRFFTATGPVRATYHDSNISPVSIYDPKIRLKSNPPKLMGGYTTNGTGPLEEVTTM